MCKRDRDVGETVNKFASKVDTFDSLKFNSDIKKPCQMILVLEKVVYHPPLTVCWES